MVTYIVIPFLLAMSKTLDRHAANVHFEHIYQVEVRSVFDDYASKLQPNQEEVVNPHRTKLTLELRCNNVMFTSMTCRLGNHTKIDPTPQLYSPEREFYRANETLDYRDLFHNSAFFQVKFKPNGIHKFVIEKDIASRRTENVYRTILEPLSIGTVIQRANDNFTVPEQSNLGLCFTKYNVMRSHQHFALGVDLVNLLNFNFHNDTIFISKHRNTCRWPSTYSFSMRLWPEFVPSMTASHLLTGSFAILMTSSHGAKFETENTYTFHNQNGVSIGHVVQTITIQYKNNIEIPAEAVHVFERDKTVEFNQTYTDD